MDSFSNAKVARLSNVISVEDVSIDSQIKDAGTEYNFDLSVGYSDPITMSYLFSKSNSANPATLVITIKKSDAIDVFDFGDDTQIGELLRISTFGTVYKNLKHEWEKVNSNKNENSTTIMYVPKVLVFMDPSSGALMESMTYINVLIVALPKADKMRVYNLDGNKAKEITVDELKKVSEKKAKKKGKDDDLCEAITTLVNNEFMANVETNVDRGIVDIADAIVKLGIKNVVIDPFQIKLFYKNKYNTIKGWKRITESFKFTHAVESIHFTVSSDEEFVSFRAGLK